MRTLVVLSLVSFLGVGTGWARPTTDAEKQALAATAEEFEVAVATFDMGHMLKMLPPRVLDSIASAEGTSTEELVQQATADWANVRKPVTLGSVRMDTATAQYLELEDGTPYALLPTEMIMSIDQSAEKRRTVARAYTLAIIDGGKWYLLRIDEPQQLILLRKSYPAFEGVEFPRAQSKH